MPVGPSTPPDSFITFPPLLIDVGIDDFNVILASYLESVDERPIVDTSTKYGHWVHYFDVERAVKLINQASQYAEILDKSPKLDI